MTVPIPRIALGALILLNVALGAFGIQLAAGKVPVPEAWAWTVPILLAVVTGATTLLPRAGSEGLAQQVDSLKAQGVPRSEMVVLPRSEAVPAVAGALTDAQLAQLVDAMHEPVVEALEARMQTTPADPLVSKPPMWLQPTPGTSSTTPARASDHDPLSMTSDAEDGV